MKFRIENSQGIRRYKPKGKRPILIRLLEPHYQQYGIPYSLIYERDYQAILDIYIDNIRTVTPQNNQRFSLFNVELCMEVLEFISQHSFDELVVHSDKGISRSPAVMLGIAHYLNRLDWVETIQNSPHYVSNELILACFEEVLNNKKNA